MVTGASRGLGRALVTAPKEFVAAEVLTAIRAERHDPPIGDEAKNVFDKFAVLQKMRHDDTDKIGFYSASSAVD